MPLQQNNASPFRCLAARSFAACTFNTMQGVVLFMVKICTYISRDYPLNRCPIQNFTWAKVPTLQVCSRQPNMLSTRRYSCIARFCEMPAFLTHAHRSRGNTYTLRSGYLLTVKRYAPLRLCLLLTGPRGSTCAFLPFAFLKVPVRKFKPALVAYPQKQRTQASPNPNYWHIHENSYRPPPSIRKGQMESLANTHLL